MSVSPAIRASGQEYTQVKFRAHAPVRFGESIRVVGDIPALGSWNVEYGEELETSPETYPEWQSSTPIPLLSGKPVRYKYAVFSGGKFRRWETFDSFRTFTPGPLQPRTSNAAAEQFVYEVEDTVEIPNPSVLKTLSASLHQDSEDTCSSSDVKCADQKKWPTVVFDDSINQNNLMQRRAGRFAKKAVRGDNPVEGAEDVEINETDGVLVVTYKLPLLITHKPDPANNLPYTISWDENALLSRKAYRRADNMRVYFIGCPPRSVFASTKEEREKMAAVLLRRFSCIAVFLDQDLHDLHWMGFCEGKLRKHMYNIIDLYGPLPNSWWDEGWHAYSAVNKAFADKIVEVFHEGDIVWIHGYELLILPSFLARRLASQSLKMEVGLFLHSPFPSSEIFRTISVRDELLRGMLNADHIGFHLYEYARHFLTCCRRILKLRYTNEGGNLSIDNQGRKVEVSVCHAGIEPEFIRLRVRHPEVPKICESIMAEVGGIDGKIVVVALDRLETLRGVSLKLLAWERLLQTHKELRSKVCLIQVLTATEQQQRFAEKCTEKLAIENEVELCRKDVNQLCAKINAMCSAESDKVVHVIEKTRLGILDRLALWSIGDILLQTPLREALCLHAFEFLVVHDECKAFESPENEKTKQTTPTLVLSEFSAASRNLTGSLRVNPWRVDEVVATLLEALTMEDSERDKRQKVDLEYVCRHTFAGWTERIVADVKRARNFANLSGFGLGHGYRSVGFHPGFTRLNTEEVVAKYQASAQRLFVLDYGGTTAPEPDSNANNFNKSSELVRPADNVINALRTLCADPRNFVFIVSGKERATVEGAFSGINGLGLTAELGYYYSWPEKLQHKIRRLKSKKHRRLSRKETAEPQHSAEEPTGDQEPAETPARKWERLSEIFDDSWMELTKTIVDVYVQRTSGTRIEAKGNSIQWQYKDADPEFGDLQASELQDHLEGVLKAFPVEVVTGKNYVEVRPQGIGKDKACEHIIDRIWPAPRHPDFVLCLGDDVADEPMFEFLMNQADVNSEQSGPLKRPEMMKSSSIVTAVVGQKPSSAQYYLDDEQDVEGLLRVLARVSNRVPFSRSLSDMRYLEKPAKAKEGAGGEGKDEEKESGRRSAEAGTKKTVPTKVLRPFTASTSLPILTSYFKNVEASNTTLEEYLEHIAEDDEGIYF